MSAILETRLRSWPDEAACALDAASIAGRAVLANAFVELHGPLGAGKTTFARHLLRSLGVEGRVKSPTYALMESYFAAAAHGGFAIAHFDFYRFDDPMEWEDAGFREVFAVGGLKLVEWPEKAAGLLPPCDLRITIALCDDGDDRDGSIGAIGGDGGDGGGGREVRFDALSRVGLELLP